MERIKLLRTMLRIRLLEDEIEKQYHLDKMKTPVHLYTGQEAIATGVCASLELGDQVQSNHRSHGHYLAAGGDMNALVAELHNRETGCSRGRGGSMHLFDAHAGYFGSSSIVGGGIPIGTGMALAQKLMKSGRISVVFFGDGAADEGTLYESVNFAVLKKLPVVYVLEDNMFSVCSPVSNRHPWKNVFLRQDRTKLLTHECDGNDVRVVFATGQEAVTRARKGEGPSLLYFQTYRMREHAGSGIDTKSGYRNLNDLAAWEARCPIKNLIEKMIAKNELTTEQLEIMKNEIQHEVDEAFKFALSSPFPDPRACTEGTYEGKKK